jgi:hypothetical protein
MGMYAAAARARARGCVCMCARTRVARVCCAPAGVHAQRDAVYCNNTAATCKRCFARACQDGFTSLAGNKVLIDAENGPVIPVVARNALTSFRVVNNMVPARVSGVRRAASKFALRHQLTGIGASPGGTPSVLTPTRYSIMSDIDGRIECLRGAAAGGGGEGGGGGGSGCVDAGVDVAAAAAAPAGPAAAGMAVLRPAALLGALLVAAVVASLLGRARR